MATPTPSPPPTTHSPFAPTSETLSTIRTVSPTPVPVFAPRPMRVSTIPNPLQRSLLTLDPPRTPSPGGCNQTTSTPSADGRASPGLGIAGIGMGRIRKGISPSPSPAYRDALDDFFKVVRQSSPGLSLKEILGGWQEQQRREREGSVTPVQQAGAGAGGRRSAMEFPHSPVSRALTRNPIAFNSQFDAAIWQQQQAAAAAEMEQRAKNRSRSQSLASTASTNTTTTTKEE